MARIPERLEGEDMSSMPRLRLGVTIVAVALAGSAFTACTKRPATTTGWTAPAPTGGTSADSTPSTPALTARPADAVTAIPGAPGAQNEPGRSGEGASRQPVQDFGAVSDLLDVHFEFDRYDIQPAQARVLDSNARWLRSNRDLVLIEGHCDERGTSEYNLALGERRAASTLSYLVSQGVSASRITIVSYGKERPQCTDNTAECRQRNRRAHFLVKRQ
jgi:peptidoglycan-associated lipoprotein